MERLTEPRLRGLVVLLAAVSVSAGWGILALALVATYGSPSIRDGFVLLMFGLIASIVPAAVCMLRAQSILRWRLKLQYAICILVILWDATLFLAFGNAFLGWFK
jgi:hypothetical protein